jgi:hypothetical protein
MLLILASAASATAVAALTVYYTFYVAKVSILYTNSRNKV